MADTYKSRKHQIRAFIRQLNLNLTRAESRRLHKAMRNAAMVGACEERSRDLGILRTNGAIGAEDKICSRSVLDVLGY